MTNDASILRNLGLMLAHEEAVKRPQAILPRPTEFACSWCQQERGEVPQAHQTHGICEQHLAE